MDGKSVDHNVTRNTSVFMVVYLAVFIGSFLVISFEGRDMVTSIALYVLLYLLITLVMSIVYAAFGLDMVTSVSASVSMMSNVGPCFGTFGSSMDSFASAPELAKILMGGQMIIGRLGIYSILLVFILYRKRA